MMSIGGEVRAMIFSLSASDSAAATVVISAPTSVKIKRRRRRRKHGATSHCGAKPPSLNQTVEGGGTGFGFHAEARSSPATRMNDDDGGDLDRGEPELELAIGTGRQ
jgi:hypothetical protein